MGWRHRRYIIVFIVVFYKIRSGSKYVSHKTSICDIPTTETLPSPSQADEGSVLLPFQGSLGLPVSEASEGYSGLLVSQASQASHGSSGLTTSKGFDVVVSQKSARESQWGDETESIVVSDVAGVDDKLLTTLESLSERLHWLEMSLRSNKDHPLVRVEKQPGRFRHIVCWNCGKKSHIARACRNRYLSETSIPRG